MDAYLEPPGFLGTGASLLADVTLLAYLLLIMPAMLLGLVFARRKLHRPHHKWLMIAVTVVNWVLIIFLMFAAYRFDVAPNIAGQPGNTRYLLPAVHGLLGIPAQLLATFIVVRMLLEDTQVARAKQRGEQDTSRYWFRSAKPIMRLTLALWLVTATLGVITYLTRYSVIPAVVIDVNVASPKSTEEVPSGGATAEIVVEPPVATEEITPEVTAVPPISTEEIHVTGATAEVTPVSTPEVVEPELRAAATAEAPVVTPEVTIPTRTRRAPAATREVAVPATTPEPPVSTPEVMPPAETPEVSEDFRVEGRLEAVGSSAVIVNGQRYDIRGARIDDPLRVGALVRMEVRSVNGQLVVDRIRVEDDD